jgi:hypothetical protein
MRKQPLKLAIIHEEINGVVAPILYRINSVKRDHQIRNIEVSNQWQHRDSERAINLTITPVPTWRTIVYLPRNTPVGISVLAGTSPTHTL